MQALFYGLFLLSSIGCVVLPRLSTHSTAQASTLLPGDTLTSTLGLFHASLVPTGCRLAISLFNNSTNTYDSRGLYNSSLFTGDCQRLVVREGRLETDTGREYLTVANLAHNYSTVFTIDDEGVMRLISTYIQENRVDIVSRETVVSTFKTVNKYLRAYSQLEVTFGDRFEAIENERKWKFIAQFGQLTVYYGENPGIKLDYVYSSLTIRDSRIYDFDNQTLPGILFTNVTLQPRCADPKIFLDFKPPYTFVANPYWPMVQVYEQGGYKILEVALSKLPQYDLNQNINEVNYHHFYSPCPRRTFEYRGNCLPSCPAPYYHQIKGESGFCVLNCQQFSTIDTQKRICSCVTGYEFDKLSLAKLVQRCPANSVETPYGCQCTASGFFYDGKLTFTCVQQCPPRTFGINSLCMQCPYKCQTCARDNFNRQFLQCKSCQTGYTLTNGQCVQTCIANYAFSIINNTCVKCTDPHCVDCSRDPNICLKCDLLFSLFSGTCVDGCIVSERNTYAQYFSASCLPIVESNCTVYLTSYYKNIPYLKCDECPNNLLSHLDKCVSQCPAGYYNHNNYCTCGGVNNLTIHDKCLNQIACPIGMSFDIRSHSCLSCPFGCISCINTQCTACNPGYFLYVSPQQILCRRKSPLFPCDQQYSLQQSTICMLNNYTDPALAMTLCYSSIPNCLVCIPQSNQICIVCRPGFKIYNNTCIVGCPAGLIAYDNTCVLGEIEECEVPHLRSVHKQAVITTTSMDNSQAYKYYTYFNIERANDPIGYMPYFQQLTTQKNDGIPRQTNFFTPQWICLKCRPGFGLSPHYKRCLPCPQQCTTKLCYMARPDSCLTPPTTPDNPSNCALDQFIQQQTGSCLQSCNATNKYPEVRNGRLFCVGDAVLRDFARVDSAVYAMKDGTKLVFFVFRDAVTAQANVMVRSFNSSSGVQVQVQGTEDGGNEGYSRLSANSVSSPLQTRSIVDGQYVELGKQPFNAYLLNLSSSIVNLTGRYDPIVFPNTLYGTVYQADHTVFMTTWLAYIGYIMSIAIILLHAVFIGNELLYKVDNLLIFAQTLFFFSFVKNLVGRLLAQFYFGWSFAHARFLPNLFSSIIPDHYIQRQAPISYKLVNIDGNYFRNAGFSLAWLLIYIAIWLVISFVIWALLYKLANRHQTWYPKIAKQTLIAGIQFFSMNLVFFSVSQLAHSGQAYQGGFEDYFNRSQVLAIITLVAMGGYTLLRWLYNPMGGLYMLKRTLIAVILVFSFDRPLLVIPLIALQLLFALARYLLQQPVTRPQKYSLLAESVTFIGCYCLLFFVLDAGVNSIIISVVMFLFIVYLGYDLTTVYLESRYEFPEEQLAKEYGNDYVSYGRAQTVTDVQKPRYMVPGSRGTSVLVEPE